MPSVCPQGTAWNNGQCNCAPTCAVQVCVVGYQWNPATCQCVANGGSGAGSFISSTVEIGN